MDRLPFSRWHVLVIAALGITWILDGLEVTIVGIVASVLTDLVSGLGLTAAQIGYAAGIYIAGASLGALFFSYLTDRYGRKKLFLITLAVYLVANLIAASVMIGAAIVEIVLGVRAERRSLESVAAPLTAIKEQITGAA